MLKLNEIKDFWDPKISLNVSVEAPLEAFDMFFL